MLKSTVEIIVLCDSTSQGHIRLEDKGPRYLSFPPWHKLYHRLLMAPIHHDTNAFTNVFLSLGCLARRAPPSSHEPSGSRGYLPPPSLLPARSDSSISPSRDTATLSGRPNDAENKKLPTFFQSLYATGTWIWLEVMQWCKRWSFLLLKVQIYIYIYNDMVHIQSVLQFTKRCQMNFDNNCNLLRKYLYE